MPEGVDGVAVSRQCIGNWCSRSWLEPLTTKRRDGMRARPLCGIESFKAALELDFRLTGL